GIGQGGEQRLRFGYLGEFQGRRKAFERRCEHSVRLASAAGRLIKLRQRQRRLQLEALRRLLLRDGDGGEEGFFSPPRVRWTVLQQYLATDAVEESVGPVCPHLRGKCHRCINPGKRGWRAVILLCFNLGKKPL